MADFIKILIIIVAMSNNKTKKAKKSQHIYLASMVILIHTLLIFK